MNLLSLLDLTAGKRSIIWRDDKQSIGMASVLYIHNQQYVFSSSDVMHV
jgi:hypothetical protein